MGETRRPSSGGEQLEQKLAHDPQDWKGEQEQSWPVGKGRSLARPKGEAESRMGNSGLLLSGSEQVDCGSQHTRQSTV